MHRQFCLSTDCGVNYFSIRDREDQANVSFARATAKRSNFFDKMHVLHVEDVLESYPHSLLVAHQPIAEVSSVLCLGS